ANFNDCNGCNPNAVCTAAGVPLPCCSGPDAGTCPAQGGCAFVQNTVFPIRVPLNGVCVPRAYPDRFCTSQAECAPVGKTCEFSSISLSVSGEDANGERTLSIAQDGVNLQPARVPPVGMACVTAGGDGEGVIDCDGGRANVDFEAFLDHNTTPGDSNNSGPALGLPDDPTCTATTVQPNGTIDRACLEGSSQCVGGSNAGAVCTVAGDCPGGSCDPCTTQPNALHGICNSPTVINQSGTFGPGDAVVALPLSITILSLGGGASPPADWGVDGLPCTADDTIQPAGGVTVYLSTGNNQATVYDAGNSAGVMIGPHAETACTTTPDCPAGQSCVNDSNSFACSTLDCVCRTICTTAPCLAELSGNPLQCDDLDADDFTELRFGGSFPALDTQALDITTLFQFQAQ
ncbi:MAG TPA: hypothetical protein VEB21_12650, partial [Terriglobales bacterium]|nr:hypothetical protein [Terriglobales bacterium]